MSLDQRQHFNQAVREGTIIFASVSNASLDKTPRDRIWSIISNDDNLKNEFQQVFRSGRDPVARGKYLEENFRSKGELHYFPGHVVDVLTVAGSDADAESFVNTVKFDSAPERLTDSRSVSQ